MPEAMLMFVHALTSLHPGSGTALGVVDLPVQRERHTNWPTIAGTSLKGVLRAEAIARNMDKAELRAVFGPAVNEDPSEHAGAISFTDARLLALPVRSLKGVFAWVTCPMALERLRRDVGLARLDVPPGTPIPAENTALVTKDSPLRQGDGVVLEEFAFDAGDGAGPIADWIAGHAAADPATRGQIKARLAVVDDNAFGHFAQHATEVTARIALDYETKTVTEGALFYEEFLPPETLLYSLVLAEKSRSKSKSMSAPEVLGTLAGLDLRTVQIGAGETIGKGVCALSFAGANGVAS